MKLLPLLFAVALAGYLARRWRGFGSFERVAGPVAVVALVLYGTGLVHLPNLDHLIRELGTRLGAWTYLLVGVLAFLETGAGVGLIVPGELSILVGGLVAGQGKIDVVTLIAIVWTCAVAGDLTSYALGRRLGRAFMLRHGPRVKITEARFEQVERFFARYGGKTILIGRFVGLVRAIAPFIAGSSRMPLRRFLPYDVIGAGLWSTTFVLLGYVFWQSFDQVAAIASKGALALGAVIGLTVAIVAAVRHLREPAHREALLARLPAWARGPARFAGGRLMPGDLGLELTTLLAAGLVGAFTFGGLERYLADHGTTAGDRRALRWTQDVGPGSLVDAAKALTALGSLSVVLGAGVVAAAVLVLRRGWLELAVLAAGLGLTVLVVHVAKDATDRPRPGGGLVDVAGSSFPSAHAAYSVAWVAIAVALWRVIPAFAGRFAVVGAALVLAVAVGLTRVILHVHYLSDVLAGWGLAAAVFAGCGALALLTDSRIRHHRMAS